MTNISLEVELEFNRTNLV